MDRMKANSMFHLWKVLMVVLVVSVIAGITMQFATIFSLDSSATKAHKNSSVWNTISSIFLDNSTRRVAGHRARGAAHVGALNLDKALVLRLRSQYGKDLGNSKVQVQVIEDIRRILEPLYPEDYQDKMNEAIVVVFPDNSVQLIKMSDNLVLYETWLQGVWDPLFAKSKKERESIVWAKRREIFGADAYKIWSDDLRVITINKVLSALNKVKGASLNDKLSFFEGTIRQEFSADADVYIRNHQQELLEKFLRLDSVQADLSKMQPQERRQSLRAVRRTFGMDETTLAHWDALEKARDERWEKGLMYMKQRQKIMDAVQDVTRLFLLDALRNEYFGKDATLVAGEEKAGYFRFKTKRIYGLN
jgi:hypothetical protein